MCAGPSPPSAEAPGKRLQEHSVPLFLKKWFFEAFLRSVWYHSRKAAMIPFYWYSRLAPARQPAAIPSTTRRSAFVAEKNPIERRIPLKPTMLIAGDERGIVDMMRAGS